MLYMPRKRKGHLFVHLSKNKQIKTPLKKKKWRNKKNFSYVAQECFFFVFCFTFLSQFFFPPLLFHLFILPIKDDGSAWAPKAVTYVPNAVAKTYSK